MKNLIKVSAVASLFAPLLALAQTQTVVGGNLGALISVAAGWVNTLAPVAFVLILLAFFYGLAKFVLNAGNEEKKAEGKQMMIYGVAAVFVAAAIWGIVYFIGGIFGINPGVTVTNPANLINTSGGTFQQI
jgi:fumarate reductase subunit D